MVLGDPAYYTQRGFHRDHHIEPQHAIPYPEAWLATELAPGTLANLTGTIQCADTLAAPQYW